MNERQELILATIIKEYIKTGVPVSSQSVVSNYGLDISSATVRNEMADLEECGFIVQPHTSAGRVPTEVAYGWYVKNLGHGKISAKDSKILEEKWGGYEPEALKRVAKTLAELSGLAVFWAIHRHNVYYTGLTNLLSQTEFRQDLLYGLSSIIDSLDEIVNDYFQQMAPEPRILIGSDGPFGNFCSAVLTKYKVGEHEGAFGILGPLRMDYERNLILMKFVYDKLMPNY